jgi:hypothetical protein
LAGQRFLESLALPSEWKWLISGDDVTTGAGLLSQITASTRVTAIGRFLRVCGGNREKRNEQNGHRAIVCSHLELLMSCLESWRP